MNDKKKAKIKDGILNLVNNEKENTPSKMASILKEDVQLIKYLCEEIEAGGYVELRIVSDKSSGPCNDYRLKPTNKGIYFLSIDGGYSKEYKSTVINKSWTITKITVAIINAIAILSIGFFSLYLSNKTNKLERENDQLKIELQKKGELITPAYNKN